MSSKIKAIMGDQKKKRLWLTRQNYEDQLKITKFLKNYREYLMGRFTLCLQTKSIFKAFGLSKIPDMPPEAASELEYYLLTSNFVSNPNALDSIEKIGREHQRHGLTESSWSYEQFVRFFKYIINYEGATTLEEARECVQDLRVSAEGAFLIHNMNDNEVLKEYILSSLKEIHSNLSEKLEELAPSQDNS